MIGLERLVDGSVTARNFDRLAQFVPDMGGRSVGVRFGKQNVSMSAAVSGTATVTHGLGKAPACVVATDGEDSGGITNVTVSAVGPTQFTLAIRFTDGVARTTTHGIYWLVIG